MGALADPELGIAPHRAAGMVADAGAELIDVREPYERQAGYVAGSRHIELAQLSAQAASIDRAKPVIFICRVGARSAMAASAFRAAGYEAYTLAGGIQAWVEDGLALEPENGYVADH